MSLRLFRVAGWLLVAACALARPGFGATELPGGVDAGRAAPPLRAPAPDRSDDAAARIPSGAAAPEAPPGAETVRFTLRAVRFPGMTVFTPEETRGIVAPYAGTEISLDLLWRLAGELTARYRDAGYFLSRAYVPEQRIEDGVATLAVVEGYVAEVGLPRGLEGDGVVREMAEALTRERPLRAATLESFLLRLGDLPGLRFRSVLTPLADPAGDGGVRLELLAETRAAAGEIRFDNRGSRYLGPYELGIGALASPAPHHALSLTALAAADELVHLGLADSYVLTPEARLEIGGAFTRTAPGYALRALDVRSESLCGTAALAYQLVRQREENLALRIGLDARNTQTDILGAAFVRDRGRALRVGASWDARDAWGGAGAATLAVSQGVPLLGATGRASANPSRAEAEPDFRKLNIEASRLQAVGASWSLLASVAGQWASGPLASFEEAGFGGESFGRAFDASELTGDHAAMGLLELRYEGFMSGAPVAALPYVFLDGGMLWNEDQGQARRARAASAGIGARFSAAHGLGGELGAAFPIGRARADPLYGEGRRGPRLFGQIHTEFE